jgi:hypothetical protein
MRQGEACRVGVLVCQRVKMNSRHKLVGGLFTSAGCLLLSAAARAATPVDAAGAQRGVLIDGASMSGQLAKQLYAAWNPHDAAAINRPGLIVSFFGSAPACALGKADGPVADLSPSQRRRTDALTGVAADTARAGSTGGQWTPTAQSPACDAKLRDERDDSLVLINPDGVRGGAGLYTSTGPDADGKPGFFGPFDAAGQNGRGANVNIEASFVTQRFDWRAPNTLRPWGGTDAGAALQISSIQSVRTMTLEPPAGERPLQVKQQLTLGVINPDCMAQGPRTGRPCQLKMLFTVALFRSGVNDWTRVGWFQGAHLLFDAAQGGIPVLDGPIMGAGQATTLTSGGPALYSSLGAPTQHSLFDDKRFDIRIEFSQFVNVMKVAAAASAKRPAARVSDADVAQLFGPRWADPRAWTLLSISVGQEVSNPEPSKSASIGGNFRHIELRAAP